MKQVFITAILMCTQLFGMAQADSAKDNVVFSKIQADAQFDGGKNAWNKFLKSNLKAGVPFANNAPAGRYVVIVRFLVNTDGTLSDFAAETKHGYGMEKEVLRVLKLSPPWKPAMQNDRPVKALKRVPVVFML